MKAERKSKESRASEERIVQFPLVFRPSLLRVAFISLPLAVVGTLPAVAILVSVLDRQSPWTVSDGAWLALSLGWTGVGCIVVAHLIGQRIEIDSDSISKVRFFGLRRKTIPRNQLRVTYNHQHGSRPDPDSITFASVDGNVAFGINLFYTWNRRRADSLLRPLGLRIEHQAYDTYAVTPMRGATADDEAYASDNTASQGNYPDDEDEEDESIERSRSVGLPDHAAIRLPLLQLIAGGQPHEGWDLVEPLAKHFRVTEAARAVSFPGGGNVFEFNVGWAVEDLEKGGLIQIVRSGPLRAFVAAFDKLRSKIQISRAGEELLAAKPVRVDQAVLMRHPAFLAEWKKDHAPISGPDPTEDSVFVVLWGGFGLLILLGVWFAFAWQSPLTFVAALSAAIPAAFYTAIMFKKWFLSNALLKLSVRVIIPILAFGGPVLLTILVNWCRGAWAC